MASPQIREKHWNWKGGVQVDNPNYYKEYNRQYSKDHWKERKVKNKESDRLWRLKNKEKYRLQLKKWRKNNPQQVSIQKKSRRHRNLAAGPLPIKRIQAVYEENIKKYGTLTCYLCNKAIEFRQDSLDHIVPLSKGGTNNRDNLAIAHRGCNSRKGNRMEAPHV